jgi:hypothetical protein
MPRDVGTERAPPERHDREDCVEGGATVLPAVVQDSHTPEHEAVSRPARLPNVPAGHSEQEEEPARAYVPG